jgi:hypothetical protein
MTRKSFQWSMSIDMRLTLAALSQGQVVPARRVRERQHDPTAVVDRRVHDRRHRGRTSTRRCLALRALGAEWREGHQQECRGDEEGRAEHGSTLRGTGRRRKPALRR